MIWQIESNGGFGTCEYECFAMSWCWRRYSKNDDNEDDLDDGEVVTCQIRIKKRWSRQMKSRCAWARFDWSVKERMQALNLRQRLLRSWWMRLELLSWLFWWATNSVFDGERREGIGRCENSGRGMRLTADDERMMNQVSNESLIVKEAKQKKKQKRRRQKIVRLLLNRRRQQDRRMKKS